MSEKTSRTIRVVAPASLAANYTFDVLIGGKPFTVVVPQGGVKEGEEFEVPYPATRDNHEESSNSSDDKSSSEDDDDEGTFVELTNTGGSNEAEGTDRNNNNSQPMMDSSGAPYGKWRTTLFSCCDVVTQSTFWMSLCCIPIVLAQLVTRYKLRWNGKQILLPVTSASLFSSENNQQALYEEASMSFNRIVITFIIVCVVANFCLPGVGTVVILLFYIVVTVWIGGNIRNHARTKYRIPPSATQHCRCFAAKCCCCCSTSNNSIEEDRCAMFFCGCCSTIQLARHTHDDKEYPGYACTTTGLQLGAPEVP